MTSPHHDQPETTPPREPKAVIPQPKSPDGVGARVGTLAALLRGSDIELADLLTAAAMAGIGSADVHGGALAWTDPRGLSGEPVRAPSAMTIRDFYESVVKPSAMAASGEEKRGGGLLRTYDSYWKVLVHGYPYQRAGVITRAGVRLGADPVPECEKLYPGLGDRFVADVRFRDLQELIRWCRVRSELSALRKTERREARGRPGRFNDHQGAVRNAVGAIRYFYAQAVLDGQIRADADLSKRLTKPGKNRSPRRAFTATELDELWQTVVSGGNDVELDRLLVHTVLVTGARREGLINLNVRDVNAQRVTLMLNEKTGIAEQPATRQLVDELLAFAISRGATRPSDPVFSFKPTSRASTPKRITDRRFDTLHARIQRSLPWADQRGVTLHWFRHHAVTTIERISSEAVAGRFARHVDQSVTRTYSKASGEEVCAAVGLMTGTVHPLADGGW